jgi:flagellar biosynthetic protein FlhB
MADGTDDDDKTEEPTQRRLDDAHEKGDVVSSTEVTAFVMLAAGTLCIAMFGPSTAEGFIRHFRIFLEQPDQFLLDGGGTMQLVRMVLLQALLLLAPIFAILFAMGIGGHLVQHRPVFSAERIKPDLNKLNPLNGLKRLFGFEGAANLIKGMIKILIVGTVTWLVLWPERGRLDATLTQGPEAIAGDMMHLLMKVLMAALSVLAVIAGGDYFLQRYRFMKRNRMSRQEIKEENRQSEGDPAVKARIRQLRQERARHRMMAAVPEATVVIMNPTHFAVALKYESGKMAAPICVAKGVDALALRIREVAEEHEVPIVENPPLARALYAAIELDETVPPEHYKAVAQVIGYVMRLTGKIRAQ